MKIDYKYTIPIQTIHVTGLACDNPNCQAVIQDSDTQKQWLSGAFQCGTNSKGKIATWCSEKCYKKCNPDQKSLELLAKAEDSQ